MNLIKKELSYIFCSPIGIILAFVYLLLTGLMLWLFGGSYNILDNGYASMDSFFSISAPLLIILIPALTMRSFAEEKRNKTFDTLLSHPISLSQIYLSKLISSWIFIVILLITTLVYPYSIYYLGNPIGNIDIQSVTASYIALLSLSFIFCSVGLFCSSTTKNQFIALLLSIIINFAIFYGFELLSTLSTSGKNQALISSFGLFDHYNLMQRGVFELSDIITIINYIALFYILFIMFSYSRNKKTLAISISSLFILNIVFFFIPNNRFDFTADKRYSISEYSKKLLDDIHKKNKTLKINIFLEGDLNPSFQRLQTAIKDIVTDLQRYSHNSIEYTFTSPQRIAKTPEEIYELMADQNMKGIVLNEISQDGKASQQVIYPYAQVISEGDTLSINLLKNIAGNTAEENINAAIENLEFEFIDAIRLFEKDEPQAIAFIEGHGEVDRVNLINAEELLSKYYFINRGQIGYRINDLSQFKAIIIAGPKSQYSDISKYIIDQYIMNGGRVLWLIDGVYISEADLANKGESPSIKNNHNLDDLLFSYGARVNPSLIQDLQSSQILLTYGDGQSIAQPWYYSLLMTPSPDNLITKDISSIKSALVSPIDIVGTSNNVTKKVLLTSSYKSHLVNIPEMITFNIEHIDPKSNYFSQSFLTTAISLEGQFPSAFSNRMQPDSIEGNLAKLNISKPTKMIVVGSSDLIRNSLAGQGENTQIIPMGYDRVANKQYGNQEFILNAVNWLVNDDKWMELRSKQQQIRLLDRNLIYQNRNLYSSINILLPILMIGIIIGLINLLRIWKYKR